MTPLPPDVLKAIQERNAVGAIKLLRAARGLGLKEAKDIIDEHIRENPWPDFAGALRPLPLALTLAMSRDHASITRANPILSLRCIVFRYLLRTSIKSVGLKCQIPPIVPIESYCAPPSGTNVLRIAIGSNLYAVCQQGPSHWSTSNEIWAADSPDEFVRRFLAGKFFNAATIAAAVTVGETIQALLAKGEFGRYEFERRRIIEHLERRLATYQSGRWNRSLVKILYALSAAHSTPSNASAP